MADKPEIFLKTKLIRPQIRCARVLRPRLIQQLEGIFYTPLTLVCAPAGYGKTTLLVDWAQASPATVAWLSLSEDENAPEAFLSYLILAIQQISPNLGKSAQAVLDFPGDLPLEISLRLLVNDLAGLPNPAVLVLDDYHLITAHPVHEMVNFLVEHLPPTFHLIIASRAEPPIAMPRFRARSAVLELRAPDLCFRSEEIETFLSQVMNLDLSAATIRSLEKQTEGWAAGLQLAALSLRSGEDAAAPAALSSGQHYIFDYLAEEVLHRLPPAMQQFLTRTAILDRVTGPLSEALEEPFPPCASGAECLDALEHANLFIQALDGEHRWYRYHALFADFLQEQLRQNEPSAIPLLHERAARWLAGQGLFEEACKHALAGNNQQLLIWLIETYAQTLEQQGELTILARWISQLPDDTVRAHPRISLTRAWISAAQLDIPAAARYLDCAEQHLQQAAGDPLRGEFLAARAFLAGVNDQLDIAERYAGQVLQLLPDKNHFLYGMLKITLSFPLILSGRLVEAIEALEDAANAGMQANSMMITLLAFRILGEANIMAGRLSLAEHSFQRAAEYIESRLGSSSPLMGVARMGLGEVYRQRHELALAENCLTEGLEQTIQWMPAMGADGFMWLAKLKQTQGDFSAAQHLLQRARQANAGTSFPILDEWFITLATVKLDIRRGRLEEALRWARDSGLDMEGLSHLDQFLSTTPGAYREEALYVIARLFLILGRRENVPDALEKAAALLEYTLPLSERTGNYPGLLEGLLLSAQVHQVRGRDQAAQDCLHRAIDLAAPEKIMGVFIDEGEPVRALLEERRKGQLPPEERAFIDLLCAAGLQEKSSLSSPSFQLIEPLSFRELEVLEWMAQGKSNQEIASGLSLSLNTVKKHASTIMDKLQAKNRMQAVLTARQHGLLSRDKPA